MIHKQQSTVSYLTKQVIQLFERAATDRIYRTVEQTDPNLTAQPSEVFEDPFLPLSREDGRNINAEQEQSQEVSATAHIEGPNSPNIMNTDGRPSPGVQLQDLQTSSYSEVARTSTPRTPQRPSAASRLT